MITTRRSRGISRSIFLRLCSRAPLMTIRSAIGIYAAARRASRSRLMRGAPRIFDCGNHARRICDSLAGDIERGAVIGRGADEWQSNCDIHGAIELQRLERNQPLIVIHRDRGVEIKRVGLADERGVGRERAVGVDAFALRAPNRGRDHADFLVAEHPAFTGMGIQPEHGDSRMGDAERDAQVRREQANRIEDVALRQCSRDFCKSHVRSHQRDRQLAAREHHAPQPRVRHLRQQLRVSGKMMSGAIHPVLANRRGHESVNRAAHRHPRASYNVIIGGAAALDCRMSGTNGARRQTRDRKYAESLGQSNRRIILMPFARSGHATQAGGGRAHRGQIANHNKRRRAAAMREGSGRLEDHFGADARRVAHANRQQRRRLSSEGGHLVHGLDVVLLDEIGFNPLLELLAGLSDRSVARESAP